MKTIAIEMRKITQWENTKEGIKQNKEQKKKEPPNTGTDATEELNIRRKPIESL